jgi:hypothetical protein
MTRVALAWIGQAAPAISRRFLPLEKVKAVVSVVPVMPTVCPVAVSRLTAATDAILAPTG